MMVRKKARKKVSKKLKAGKHSRGPSNKSKDSKIKKLIRLARSRHKKSRRKK